MGMSGDEVADTICIRECSIPRTLPLVVPGSVASVVHTDGEPFADLVEAGVAAGLVCGRASGAAAVGGGGGGGGGGGCCCCCCCGNTGTAGVFGRCSAGVGVYWTIQLEEPAVAQQRGGRRVSQLLMLLGGGCSGVNSSSSSRRMQGKGGRVVATWATRCSAQDVQPPRCRCRTALEHVDVHVGRVRPTNLTKFKGISFATVHDAG